MKHKSEDYKMSVVKHYLNSLNYTKTAVIFGCSRQSLMRWVKQFKKNKNTKRKIIKHLYLLITITKILKKII